MYSVFVYHLIFLSHINYYVIEDWLKTNILFYVLNVSMYKRSAIEILAK